MEVKKGDEASIRYRHYLQNKLNPQEAGVLFKGLDDYCKQDTLAMVKLLEIIEGRLGVNNDKNDANNTIKDNNKNGNIESSADTNTNLKQTKSEEQKDIAVFSSDSNGQMGFAF